MKIFLFCYFNIIEANTVPSCKICLNFSFRAISADGF